MNQLTITNHNGIDVVDSRIVAEFTDKQHKHLLADIRGYIAIMEESGEPKIRPSDFFIESTYLSEQNKELPCFLCTKKGCDMVANKMTGEKGVLFTAAYVTAFEQMREHIQTGKPLPKSRKSDQELAAADKRAKAMLINAKCRTVDKLTALYDRAGVKAEYQALAISDLFADDGLHLPRIALQGTKVTYDKGTIAKMLGVYSEKGLPHAQAIGKIIDQLDIVDDEREAVPHHRNGHDGTDYQYTQSVVDKVGGWLLDRKSPNPIPAGGKNFRVQYKAKEG